MSRHHRHLQLRKSMWLNSILHASMGSQCGRSTCSTLLNLMRMPSTRGWPSRAIAVTMLSLSSFFLPVHRPTMTRLQMVGHCTWHARAAQWRVYRCSCGRALSSTAQSKHRPLLASSRHTTGKRRA